MSDSLLSLDDVGDLSSLMDDVEERASGEKYFLELDLIDADPNQPRKTFDKTKLGELAESITHRGVLQPISVRDNPDSPGRYIINQGERRYRASLLANKDTIPVVIDNDFIDDDQMIENIQREELTHEEVFNWISAKLDAGVKKGEIAKRLGKSNAFVSQYVTLLTISDELHELFSGGRCRDLTVINELVKLEKKNNELVHQWISDPGDDDITRSTVRHIKQYISKLENEELESVDASVDYPESDTVESNSVDHSDVVDDEHGEIDLVASDSDDESDPESHVDDPNSIGAASVDYLHAIDTSQTREESSKINAILLCEHNGSSGRLVLDRRPTGDGLVWLRLDHGNEIEVNLSEVVLLSLIEV